MCHSLFTHSLTEGQILCLQVFAIMNKAAINIHVQGSLLTLQGDPTTSSQGLWHTDFLSMATGLLGFLGFETRKRLPRYNFLVLACQTFAVFLLSFFFLIKVEEQQWLGL